jgi:hypothetical protein
MGENEVKTDFTTAAGVRGFRYCVVDHLHLAPEPHT